MRCPICTQGNLRLAKGFFKDYISNEQFRLLRCDRCRSALTDYEPDASAPCNYYGPAYYNNSRGKFTPVLERIFRWNHQRNAKKIYRDFSPERVLEVGCGRAYLLQELQELGVNVTCLESTGAADWILNNQKISVAVLSEEQEHHWPFPDQYFDLIIFWHVFEHLPNPIQSLEQATKMLKSGKTICISVPNSSSLQARIKLAAWFHLDVPRHLYHFSQVGLVELLEKHDYEIKKIAAGDAIQNLYGWFQTLANLFTPGRANSLYQFLQGGEPLIRVSKVSLLVQLLSSVVWLPLGLLGYLVEELTRQYGSVTIIAKKR
jgi:SAM-dependent methyltransferase